VIRADAPSAARPTHTAPRHSRMITYGPYRHPYVRLRSHALCPRYSDDGAATAITTATRRSRQRRNGSVLKVAGANELRSAQGPRHDERERRDHASRCVEAGWQHQGLGTPAPKGGKEATTVKNSEGAGASARHAALRGHRSCVCLRLRWGNTGQTKGSLRAGGRCGGLESRCFPAFKTQNYTNGFSLELRRPPPAR
jgi:hypothetical protein